MVTGQDKNFVATVKTKSRTCSKGKTFELKALRPEERLSKNIDLVEILATWFGLLPIGLQCVAGLLCLGDATSRFFRAFSSHV